MNCTIIRATDFRETIRERAQREPRFRKALLREAIELMLSGDEKTGRATLRNYINATVGFRQLEEATSIPATSLMRMFGAERQPIGQKLVWRPRSSSGAGRREFRDPCTPRLMLNHGGRLLAAAMRFQFPGNSFPHTGRATRGPLSPVFAALNGGDRSIPANRLFWLANSSGKIDQRAGTEAYLPDLA
jgi:hypothetical protein